MKIIIVMPILGQVRLSKGKPFSAGMEKGLGESLEGLELSAGTRNRENISSNYLQ